MSSKYYHSWKLQGHEEAEYRRLHPELKKAFEEEWNQEEKDKNEKQTIALIQGV